MAIIVRKKKDPSLKLSKYPQYIIDLNKPDKPLKFYKEAKWAGYTNEYIENALIVEFGIEKKQIESMFIHGETYIKKYEQDMWNDFYKCNPEFKGST